MRIAALHAVVGEVADALRDLTARLSRAEGDQCVAAVSLRAQSFVAMTDAAEQLDTAGDWSSALVVLRSAFEHALSDAVLLLLDTCAIVHDTSELEADDYEDLLTSVEEWLPSSSIRWARIRCHFEVQVATEGLLLWRQAGLSPLPNGRSLVAQEARALGPLKALYGLRMDSRRDLALNKLVWQLVFSYDHLRDNVRRAGLLSEAAARCLDAQYAFLSAFVHPSGASARLSASWAPNGREESRSTEVVMITRIEVLSQELAVLLSWARNRRILSKPALARWERSLRAAAELLGAQRPWIAIKVSDGPPVSCRFKRRPRTR